jgi:hypothetical protein
MRVTVVQHFTGEVVAQWNGQAPVVGQIISVGDRFWEIQAVVIQIADIPCDDPEVRVCVERAKEVPW